MTTDALSAYKEAGPIPSQPIKAGIMLFLLLMRSGRRGMS